MTLSFADYIAALIFSALGAGVGAYFGAFLKRKGENVATHEDLEKLVDQVRATTAATEAIRTELSGKPWETQERWRVKKDVYARLIKGIQDGARALNGMWWVVEHQRTGAMDTIKGGKSYAANERDLEAAKQEIRGAWALSQLVAPEIADVVDNMWRSADDVAANLKTTTGSSRERKCMFDALDAIIESGTGEQLSEVRRYTAARGWTAAEYVDRGISGSKDRRAALDQLVSDARRRRFDVVVVWRLDRLGRNLRHLVTLLEELATLGIAFVSLNEGIDATTPAGKLQMHILGAIAEFERARIIERVKAGLRRARAEGKHLGRPRRRITTNDLERTAQFSVRAAARLIGVSRAVLHRARLSQKAREIA
jgi:DNA invertase Pin-like site-specific DNA recombinase